MGQIQIPAVTINPVEGAANVAQPNPAGAHITIGVCSLGSANNLYSAGNQNTLLGLVGYGPAPQAAAYDLDVAAGPAYVMPVNPSVSGSNGSVIHGGAGGSQSGGAKISNNGGGTNYLCGYLPGTGTKSNSSVTHTGTGTGVVTISSGTATVDAQMFVLITTSGSQTSAIYSVSLDGGVSFPIVGQTLAASNVTNGITWAASNVSSDTYVAGDVYYWTSVINEPQGTATDITVTGTPLPWAPQFLSGLYNINVLMTTGGARGSAAFTYSLDGGLTYPFGEITTAATVPLGSTGLTLAFASDTYYAADQFFGVAVVSSGSGCGKVSVSGTAYDGYLVQVQITANGLNLAAATGTFAYSLDGGNSYSGSIAIPTGGTYIIPNSGLTLTFANGTGVTSSTAPSFQSGDVYTFATVPNGYSTTDLTNAWDAAIALSTPAYSYLHIVGSPVGTGGGSNSPASKSAAVFAALSSLVDGAWTGNQFPLVLMQCGQDSDANCESAFANEVDFRINVGGGQEYLQSPIDGRSYKRGVAYVVSGRTADTNVGIDAAEFDLGPAPGVAAPLGSQTALVRDERLTPGLNAARFSTMMTFQGAQGFYLCNALTMESNSGSYPLWAQARVLAAACQISYLTLLKYLSKAVRVNSANASSPLVPGAIDPRDAANINGALSFALKSALLTPNQISAVTATVDQTTNVLATGAITVNVAIVGLAYIKQITCNIGNVNPALTLPT